VYFLAASLTTGLDVPWMGLTTKQRRSPRTSSAAAAGATNLITCKAYMDEQYKPLPADAVPVSCAAAMASLSRTIATTSGTVRADPLWVADVNGTP
jgi:hypothetical protein